MVQDGRAGTGTAGAAAPSRIPPSLRTVALSLLLAAFGAGLLLAAHDATPFAGHRVSWPVLVLLFVGSELLVLHIQVQREAQAVSVSEVPLVIGLFFADATELVAARVLGSLLVLVLQRRSSLIKTFFNLCLILAETTLALSVAHWVAGAPVTGPPSWIGAFAAVLAATTFSVLALTAVIGIYESVPSVPELARELLRATGTPLVLCAMTLVGITTVVGDPQSVWLVLAALAALVVSYRAYANLWDRHLSLERLYQFSQVVGSSPEVDVVLQNVLVQACDLLRSEQGAAVFFDGGGGRAAVVQRHPSGRFTRQEESVEQSDWLRYLLEHRDEPALLARGTSDPRKRRWLDNRGLREALVVPLRSSSQSNAVLFVGDRLGEVRAFDHNDVLLLETVANHAGTALQNGRLIDKLRHDSLHDALTGLPNRVALQRHLNDVLATVAPGRSVAVMILDLDGFKEVNDSLGHHQGDRLLVEVATRFSDAVGEVGMVARLGGDEFAVVAVAEDDLEAVERLGRRLLAALELPVSLDSLEVEVGASVGVALAPRHGQEAAALLKAADIAMYLAKSSTGGLKLYESQMASEGTRRLFLVGELRQALHQRQLEIHVQPQVVLGTGQVTSVEALLRWRHPDQGWLSPSEFIPVAERSGLIQQVTSFVLDAGIAACAMWRAHGLELGVAVNLSTRSLLDADVVLEVARILARYDVPARLITLEITESAAMAEPGRAVAVLEQLRALGVRLSVDDFGTGYSSLSYLKRLPVNEVKIDRSFVSTLAEEGGNSAIVNSVIALGGHLDLEVVAEGIEDEATVTLLKRLGCAKGQGYHLGRPMPVGELLGWLAGRSVPGDRPDELLTTSG